MGQARLLFVTTLCASMAIVPSLAGPVLRAALPAVVTTSDGEVLAGQLRIIGPRPLTIVPFGEKRQRTILLSDVVSIEHQAEKETLERPWTFKESGRPEKVYFEGKYPLINFQTRILLVNGSTVVGHVISAVMELKTADGKRKLFLKRQIKGTKEQRLADLDYPTSIRFTDARASGSGPISGSLKGAGRLLLVTALDNEREQILTAKVTGERFDFGNVLPGSYDLCMFTDRYVLVGHSDAVPQTFKGAPLQDDDRVAINKKFPLADDFFTERWILSLCGHRGFAKALVYKRREKYYESEKWTPGGFLWHLEVWRWHFVEPDWKIDRRYILIRHKQKGAEKNRKLIHCKRLDAVIPGHIVHIDIDTLKDENQHFIRDLN